MPNILVDSSYLVALGYPPDVNHRAAQQFSGRPGNVLLVPDVVLPEAFYNLRRIGNTRIALQVADALMQQSIPLVSVTKQDFGRAIEIMRQYREADLDLVDCCITALAERLNITRICTFDRRDFSIIRPKHVSYLELFP